MLANQSTARGGATRVRREAQNVAEIQHFSEESCNVHRFSCE
jgi:hypothetical protein